MKFYYPIKLHYSQTMVDSFSQMSKFYYPIKLHYSQTMGTAYDLVAEVLLPYKITLLSNDRRMSMKNLKGFTTL